MPQCDSSEMNSLRKANFFWAFSVIGVFLAESACPVGFDLVNLKCIAVSVLKLENRWNYFIN